MKEMGSISGTPGTRLRADAGVRTLYAALVDSLDPILDELTRVDETLSVGRQSYHPPKHLRTVLALDDETCRFPGCGRRANRCELDHTVAWAHGGQTSHANLAHLCSKHHHLKHESRWSVKPGPSRALTWTSPTGREHTTRPADRSGTPPPGPRFEPLRV
jgi:hypothetical protein